MGTDLNKFISVWVESKVWASQLKKRYHAKGDAFTLCIQGAGGTEPLV